MPAAEQNRINLAPWYLIAGKDELALKLRSELVVGEDSQGNLKLDPTSPSERWVKFKLDENILMMSVLHPDLSARWDTDSLSNVEKSVVLEPGTVISLPSTEIYVSHSLRRGKRFSTLIVENHPLPAAVVEPDLNIVMAEPKSNPSNDVLTTDAEPPLLEDKLPPPAASQPIIVTEPHGETKPTSNRQSKGMKVVSFAAVAAVAVVVGIYFLAQTITESAKPNRAKSDISTTQATLDITDAVNTQVPETAETQTQQASQSVALDEPQSPSPAINASQELDKPVALAAPEVQPAAQITETERLPDPFIQARIAKAKEYLAKGYITAPPIENAVTQLELALYREPTNAEALELMSIAAQRMLAAAETAKQAGFDFEARNLLEELLAFHPEHVEANRLWREWLDEPAPFQ